MLSAGTSVKVIAQAVEVADGSTVAVSVPGVPTVGEAAGAVEVATPPVLVGIEVATPVVLVGTAVVTTVLVRVLVATTVGTVVFVPVAVLRIEVRVAATVTVGIIGVAVAAGVFVPVAVATRAVFVLVAVEVAGVPVEQEVRRATSSTNMEVSSPKPSWCIRNSTFTVCPA